MPLLSELQQRFQESNSPHESLPATDDILIPDARATWTPADIIEQKLSTLLPTPRLLELASPSE